MSQLELDLIRQIRDFGIPEPEREWPFGHGRCRFDLAWPDYNLAVEVEGGTWMQGRHSRGTGYAKDCEKYNAATLMGWRVLRVTSDMVRNGKALTAVKTAWETFVDPVFGGSFFPGNDGEETI